MNSVYGKFGENVLKRKAYNIETDPKKAEKRARACTYREFQVINETEGNEAVAFLNAKESVCLDRPIYFSVCILDIAKKIMFDFYYDVVKKIFPESTSLMTDTDSLLFEVGYDGDINEVLKANEKYFDFSNLPENHRLFDPTRANRPALF